MDPNAYVKANFSPVMLQSTADDVMHFYGQPVCNGMPAAKPLAKCKRKTSDIAATVMPVTKRHITDELMAQHLKDLHISSQFTAHMAADSQTAGAGEAAFAAAAAAAPSASSMDINPPETSYRSSRGGASMYSIQKDLQRKLSKAQRITLCDEIRNIQSEAPLPESLLYHRHERPCNALVLWQPPLISCNGDARLARTSQPSGDNQPVEQNSSGRSTPDAVENEMLCVDEDNGTSNCIGFMDLD